MLQVCELFTRIALTVNRAKFQTFVAREEAAIFVGWCGEVDHRCFTFRFATRVKIQLTYEQGEADLGARRNMAFFQTNRDAHLTSGGYSHTQQEVTWQSPAGRYPTRRRTVPDYDVKDLPNDIMTLMLATVVEHNSSLYAITESGTAVPVSSLIGTEHHVRSHKWFPPDVEGRRIELLKRRVGIQNWSNWSESLRNCPQFSPEFWHLLRREMDQSTQRSVTGSIELRESDIETFKISWKDHDPDAFNEFAHACVELAKSLQMGPQARHCLQSGLTAGSGAVAGVIGGEAAGMPTSSSLQTPGVRRPLTAFGATPFAKTPFASPQTAKASVTSQQPTPFQPSTGLTTGQGPENEETEESVVSPFSRRDRSSHQGGADDAVPIPTGSMLGRSGARGYRPSLSRALGSTTAESTAPTSGFLNRALFKTPAAPEGGRTQSRMGLLGSAAKGLLASGDSVLASPQIQATGSLVPVDESSHQVVAVNDQLLDPASAPSVTEDPSTLVIAPESVQSMIFPKHVRPAERVLGTGVDPIAKWSQVPMEQPDRLTVFGYAPSQAGQVLERLSAFGDIIRRVDGPTGQWMCVTFASVQSALRALGTGGHFRLSDGTLVGVQPFMKEHLAPQVVSSTANRTTNEAIIRSRAAASARIFAQPTPAESGGPRQNTCEKILRFIFNW